MFELKPEASLVIMRHAEAFKNLDKIHGGGIQTLTERGITQALNSAEAVIQACDGLGIQSKSITVYCQTEDRSQYTAEYIANALGQKPCVAKDIYGIGLGVISSLDEETLAKMYPEVTSALLNWRAGSNGLRNYPRIPGSESTKSFASRIYTGLENIVFPGRCTILIATTSVINMVVHLLTHEGIYIRDEYAFSEYPFCGFSIWKLDYCPRLLFSSF